MEFPLHFLFCSSRGFDLLRLDRVLLSSVVVSHIHDVPAPHLLQRTGCTFSITVHTPFPSTSWITHCYRFETFGDRRRYSILTVCILILLPECFNILHRVLIWVVQLDYMSLFSILPQVDWPQYRVQYLDELSRNFLFKISRFKSLSSDIKLHGYFIFFVGFDGSVWLTIARRSLVRLLSFCLRFSSPSLKIPPTTCYTYAGCHPRCRL